MTQAAEQTSRERSVKRQLQSVKRSPRSLKRPSEDLRSWEQVNQRLASLGESERQIRSLRDQFEQKVAVLKQQWLEASRPVLRDQKKIECQIERFFWAHRSEVLAGGRKSVDLVFGRLGSRHSRSVVVRDAAAAIDWLRDNGFKRYLRIRTELDREALRSTLAGAGVAATDAGELLRCPGIRLREADEFWYEVDDLRLDRTPLPAVCSQACHAPPVAGLIPGPSGSDPNCAEPDAVIGRSSGAHARG